MVGGRILGDLFRFGYLGFHVVFEGQGLQGLGLECEEVPVAADSLKF